TTVVPAPVLAEVKARMNPRALGPRKRRSAADVAAFPHHALSPEQSCAVEAILEACRAGGRVLLFGITGSGKTEVYLQAVERVLAEGSHAVVLVPEVSLTPQAVERYRGRLGEQVGVLHSGLAAGERREQWWKLRRGELTVALGTRSAVFAPLERPALFILDEEHDHSYKQDQTPRYHARQVAVRRAQQTGAAVVLGSATPSLETFYLAESGYYRLLELPQRATGGTLPEVELVDMRRAPRRKLLSQPLVQQMREAVASDAQVVLLLNRRGFSNYLQCQACGHVEKCIHCSISLTFHRRAGALRCHYCGHSSRPPEACRGCGGSELQYRGGGTERLEEELAEALPGVPTVRLDRDTTSGAGKHAELLGRFARREAKVLLGTQMVSKGLDFPDVTLVGVVHADAGLNLPDFRAAERTFQLITQVAGRAGRGQRPGHVMVQTMEPEHGCLQAAARHDYRGFYAEELKLRRQLGYPPFCRLLRLVASGPQEAAVQAEAVRLAESLSRRTQAVDLLGPAPCPLERVRGRWRWHVLARGPKLQDLVGVARTYFETRSASSREDVHWSVDPDPQDLL
ncbi:MAG: primosomal protein N', partial [Candidatus Eremiobacterota bacterium]